jgi:Domain of unknown function (DUF4430)
VRRAALVAVAAVALGGCGFGSGGTSGKAKLWVTRDRGSRVVLVREVPAGQTALQALARVAKVKTRYGGRFVQSIDGVAGSLAKERDWFYFINGYEADRGAADYKLHSGDVEWWDYRPWKGSAIHVPVVVGAFPEPFLHGYDGKRRKATIVFESRGLASEAKALGKLIHAEKLSADELEDANILYLTRADVPLQATTKGAGDPVRFIVGPKAARRILADRKAVRFRYSGLR